MYKFNMMMKLHPVFFCCNIFHPFSSRAVAQQRCWHREEEEDENGRIILQKWLARLLFIVQQRV